jgi:hypothetical protein
MNQIKAILREIFVLRFLQYRAIDDARINVFENSSIASKQSPPTTKTVIFLSNDL